MAAPVKDAQKEFGPIVGGFPPATLSGALYCEQEGRYRLFAFKELRTIKNCPDVVAEVFACGECQWTRQWGARG